MQKSVVVTAFITLLCVIYKIIAQPEWLLFLILDKSDTNF